MTQKLFAVMLGGNPPGTGVEIHDVVFSVGACIEDTFDQLRRAWFASGKPPHIDSWLSLEQVDGFEITLAENEVPSGQPDLWHVNLGWYEAGGGRFRELHEDVFLVATDAASAKARAKALGAMEGRSEVHADKVNRVSDRLAAFGAPWRVRLREAAPGGMPRAQDGYWPFAK